MGINRVIISGNLTRDPELSATQSGMQVLRMGVAVNDRRKNNATGEWEDYPNFIDCTMFGNRAEAVSLYLLKGSKVAIEGRLHYSSWETKEGQKRSKLEVVVDEIVLMTSREQKPAQAPQQQPPQYAPMQQQAPAYAPPQQGYGQQQMPVAAPHVDVSLYDEAIPF